jgi:hypothetical protein
MSHMRIFTRLAYFLEGNERKNSEHAGRTNNIPGINLHASIQHCPNHLNCRIMRHGIQVVRHLAQHIPTNLRGMQYPQYKSDRLRRSNLVKERSPFFGCQLLGIIQSRWNARCGTFGIPECCGVRHRSKDGTATCLVNAQDDTTFIAVVAIRGDGGGNVGEEERAGAVDIAWLWSVRVAEERVEKHVCSCSVGLRRRGRSPAVEGIDDGWIQG